MVKPTTHIGKTSGVWDNRFEQRAWIQWDRNVDPEVENGMNANSYGVCTSAQGAWSTGLLFRPRGLNIALHRNDPLCSWWWLVNFRFFGTRRVTFNELISAGDFARLSGGSL